MGVYKNMNLGVVTLAFRCRVTGGESHTPEESRRVIWLTVDEGKQRMPEARYIRVADAMSEGGLFVRVHDGTDLLNPGTRFDSRDFAAGTPGAWHRGPKSPRSQIPGAPEASVRTSCTGQ
jgi:hypothetical protein